MTARDAIGPREVAVLVADPGRTATTFASVTDALRAARLLQRAARADDRPPPRVAVHIGDAHRPPDGRVDGAAARTCTRLRDIAGAGSIVVSGPAATTLDDPDLRDAGLHRLRDLSPPIRVFVVGTAPAPSSVDALPNNLPTQLTTFVGRDGDVDAVCAVLRRSRLVTLTGPGGCGKTRLAARAAAETVERWPDGVGWVELGAVRDPAAIPELVAAAVGVLPGPARDATPSLSRQLRDRRVLVCLDNCEHLLDASAALVQELLLSCPEVAILTTSREPLTVPGEAVWRVPPMNRADSVTLFRERAGLVRPDAAADDTAAVRTACARLDGMPLAVELAAAWTGTLTPQQIVRGIDDRFALLIRGPRGVAARHQTLAASIDWSHDLLADADRVLFRRLAAFHGSFTLDAARAVAAFGDLDGSAVLAGLRRLVDKSLVVAEAGRYRMLESLHRYADTRLRAAGEHDVTRDRLLDAVLAMVEEAGPDLDGDKDAYVATLALEHENLTVALERGLLREDAEPVRRLAAGLAWLWHLNGHGAEGIEVLRAAIERSPRDRSALQGRLLTGLALVADTARPLGLEYDAAQAGLEIATDAGDARTRCMALQLCAVGRFYTDFDAAWDYATTAAAEALAAGETFVVHGTEALKGIILHLRDDHVAAVPRLHAAVDGLLRHGNRAVAATSLGFLAVSALRTGAAGRAHALATRAVRVAEPLADYHRVGWTRSVLAAVQLYRGRADEAAAVLEPVLRLVDGSAVPLFVPGLARAMGTLHMVRGAPAEAATWFGRDAGSTDGDVDTHLAALALPGLAAALRAGGDPGAAAAAAARGLTVARRMGMPGAVADALEQQAHLATDGDRATDLHHQALTLRSDHVLRPATVDSLEAVAVLAAQAGRGAEAARLLAACDRARAEMGCPRARPLDATEERIGSLLGAGAHTAARTEGRKLGLDEAVAYARRARGTRGRPAAGWASLTPAELRVVQLAVAGMHNPEIGRRLFISRGTVKTHLSHVYAKLGVANRTELAAAAARRP